MLDKHHSYFKFLDWNLDTLNHQLHLNYEIQHVGMVTEVLSFPSFNLTNITENQAKINAACELIHLMCGVSYYKAGLAKNIYFETPPSQLIAGFIEKTWKNGLAELAFENNVSIDFLKLTGNGSTTAKHLTSEFTNNNQSLVAIGGGKDSLVTIEELLQQDKEITLFMVGNSALIKEVANFTELPLLNIKRTIDPKLIEYNKTGNGFNGHVPITAINSCVAVLTALLFEFNEIVFSNERSADSANTTNSDGKLVNHQYSKSLEFETDLSNIINHEITSNLKYYSQQRCFSELAILEKFSHYPQYFPVFSSCNRNFHIDGSHNKNSKWCCHCPKCRFVFLGLAPFVDKDQLLNIFKNNLLDDMTQLEGFEELLGIKGFKPFECVGEIEESQLAFNLIKNKQAWKNNVLVKKLSESVPENTEQQYNEIMQSKEL